MDDRALGSLILAGSLAGVFVYFYLLFLSPWALLVIRVSSFAAVGAVLVIVAWIGYTMATTPPLEPLDVSMEDSPIEEDEPE